MYSVRIAQDELTTGGICYMAEHPELLACQGSGKTIAEAQADLDEARQGYLASLREDCLPIPAPFCQREGTQGAALSVLLALDGCRGRLMPWQAD